MLENDIIKTDIVTDQWNVFWNDISESIKNKEARETLVLSTPYAQESPEEQQLQKMLQACKLNPEDYNVVMLKENEELAWHKLREQLQAKRILLVGVMPAQLGISALFRLNEANRFNDCVFIPTLSIAELEKQPEMKKQLWNNALKPVFVG